MLVSRSWTLLKLWLQVNLLSIAFRHTSVNVIATVISHLLHAGGGS